MEMRTRSMHKSTLVRARAHTHRYRCTYTQLRRDTPTRRRAQTAQAQMHLAPAGCGRERTRAHARARAYREEGARVERKDTSGKVETRLQERRRPGTAAGYKYQMGALTGPEVLSRASERMRQTFYEALHIEQDRARARSCLARARGLSGMGMQALTGQRVSASQTPYGCMSHPGCEAQSRTHPGGSVHGHRQPEGVSAYRN
eukprot:5132546-Pleurochrysis_carterae.AAC.1